MIHFLAQNKHVRLALYVLVGAFSIALFLKNAWAAEDSFIILRSVDQFLAGNGFRWNPHERVQVYTSPLWYLLIIASTVFCKTLYLNLIALSLGLHVLLLWVSARLLHNIKQWLLLVCLLSFSQGFFDFTSSGLEYPLIYFLLASFVLLYLRNQHITDRYALALSAGLLLITRHDTLLVITPLLLHLGVQYCTQLSTKERWKILLFFSAPLMLWTLFSLLYYGMPFPNTAYGKLNIDGVSRLERLERGWIYLSKSLQLDPITPLLIFFAALHGWHSRCTVQRTTAAGLLLGVLYIFWIGGDYMLGRFYAPLYLVAALLLIQTKYVATKQPLLIKIATGLCLAWMLYYWLLSGLGSIDTFLQAHHWTPPPLQTVYIFLGSVAGALLLLSLLPMLATQRISRALLMVMLIFSTQQFDSPWQTRYKNWGKNSDFDMWWNLNNVSRERYFIYHWTSLYAWLHRDPAKLFPDHPWCYEGAAMPTVTVIGLDGIIGYCMGIDKIAIDSKALTDPLLARMPKTPEARWSSGGVNRQIPAGYLDSVATGENRISDPDLAAYYDKLRLIISADQLFSLERLRTITAFHLGVYDHWLQAYLARQNSARQNPTTQDHTPP